MKYYYTKSTNYSFEEAVEITTNALKEEGFGIISEIDVQKTLKEKINRDFKRYLILGACNPTLAHEALLAEDKMGIMMPCNVTIIEQPDGIVEVSALNPMILSDVVKNDRLECFATDVRGKLRRVLARI
ncbi:MAG: DUF302 domain-containing protein [Bacteroidales bacterium]|nr:DUF302 domain-containing protein [Bacteroidales bacterium]MCF8457649.1 DUF302 domain-containing protein [Bacteroidales bacterium]